MTFSELKTELNNRLSITATNTFWTQAMLENWLNQANYWACTYKHWPFTEKAKTTTTKVQTDFDYDVYDYPSDFRSDSIRRLEIKQSDGTIKKYQKVRYEDFLNYVEDEGDDYIFSDFRRRIFIYPKVKTAGLEISIWGQEKPEKMINDSDKTPFAEGDEAGEEAIIKRALMIALQKAKKYQEAAIEREEAKIILEELWARIQEEQITYQSKDNPFFDVPNFLDY